MKKIVIVNCFDTYEERVDLLHDFFRNEGNDVTIIQSNFKHFKKVHRNDEKEGFVFVASKPYRKNMSAARLISHYNFAKKAFTRVEEIEPDILYVVVPPNSLAKFAAQYKRKNKNVKLIFDLIDLWPEAMPLDKVKNLFPLSNWRKMRDSSLKYADLVITECNLYQKILRKVLSGLKTETVYLAKREIQVNKYVDLSDNELHLCYLGSINNIIDISKIKEIIKSLNDIKPTTLHIIGDGESKQLLINQVKETGSKIEYHGKIYDTQLKQKIFDKCHFGLNIMKDSVSVGLTMKSIDYLQHELPIINNIQDDTAKIVEQYGIGLNVTGINIKEVANRITSTEIAEFIEMRKNAKRAFENLFSQRSFELKLKNIINDL